MDIRFSDEHEAFRAEVAAFVGGHLPERIRTRVTRGLHLDRQDYVDWHSLLADRRWLAGHWPREFGGCSWGAVERFLFDNEMFLADAPRIVPFGPNMLGPVLIRYGTPEQQRRFLPRILDGSHWWCQGFSEPGAGSDLASLQTRAEFRGDHYLVNGQKTWTTLAHYANWMFCLVRTDNTGKPQQGISFLLIDMDSPGVDVQPIVTLDGTHEVNNVFLTDVEVPIEHRVGEENQGWTCAKYLLTYERTGLATVGYSTARLAALKRVASAQLRRGKPLTQDPDFARRLARLEIELDTLKTTNLRVISSIARDEAPAAASSMLKILGTRVRQELADLNRLAMGPYALPHVPGAFRDDCPDPAIGPEYANAAAPDYFNSRKGSIFGGSTEVQKNIISKQLFSR